MDRLHVVVSLTAVILFVGCEDKPKASAPVPTSRVNAVAAKAKVAEAPEDFCDVYHADPSAAPQMSYPEMDIEAEYAPKGWTWVNVWATWCEPCVEEMPRLVAWESELDAVGKVTFVSADDTREVMDKFLSEHAELKSSARLAAADALKPWLNELGLAGASLPTHLFLDEAKRVRCIRMGGVTDNDRPAVERLLAGN